MTHGGGARSMRASARAAGAGLRRGWRQVGGREAGRTRRADVRLAAASAQAPSVVAAPPKQLSGFGK